MEAIATPRAIIILVQAGKPVDDTIALLSSFMAPGDMLIDGGNEWFPNTIRRGKELEPKGIHFMGEARAPHAAAVQRTLRSTSNCNRCHAA